MTYHKLKLGQTVWWHDPDDELLSGWYTIIDINGKIFFLENEAKSTVEAYRYEIEEREITRRKKP